MRFPLAHPIAIGAVLLLLVNDHVLKRAFPGVVTGKLSDVAGMVFFPLLLVSFVDVLRPRLRASTRLRILAGACAATAVVFAATKTLPVANEAYRFTWAAMGWPFRALRAAILHRAVPGLSPVVLVRDPTDLVAVPFVLVAWWVGRGKSETDLRVAT
jgi:hypothetical protein